MASYAFTEKNEKRETEAYCELELSDIEQWKESYNNGRRPHMLNDIAAWKSLLCTSPFVDGVPPSYVPVRYNNARLSECPSRLLRALWASRCTKYKHAFALFIPIRLYGEISCFSSVAFNHHYYCGNVINEKLYFNVSQEILLIGRDKIFHFCNFYLQK